MSVNKAILVGRVGRDPETRFTGTGQQVTNWSIATSEKYKDREGNKQEKTEWHKLTAWGKLAEIVQQYVKKGMLIFVEGKIETREWQDKEGIKRYTTGITVREMKMLGGGERSDQSKPAGHESAAPAEAPIGDISDEDIPF